MKSGVKSTKYEDDINIGTNRYKNTKLKSLQFYNAAIDHNGYSSRFFEDLQYPITLVGLKTYLSSY